MEGQWAALEAIDSRVRMAQARIQHKIKVPGRSKARPSQPSSSRREPYRPLSASSPQSDPQPPSDLSPDTEDQDTHHPTVATIVDAPMKVEGHTMLWRAGLKKKHDLFYDAATGIVNLAAISSFPGDFSGQKKVPYFTPQKETADRYARWLKHKAPNPEVTIAQVAVDWTWVKRLTTEYLWLDSPHDIWKKVIFQCRRESRLPTALVYIEERDILIGHIASGVNVRYERMNSYEQITDSLTVKVDGHTTAAIQFVFQTRKAQEEFEEHCKGKIWLHSVGAFKRASVTEE